MVLIVVRYENRTQQWKWCTTQHSLVCGKATPAKDLLEGEPVGISPLRDRHEHSRRVEAKYPKKFNLLLAIKHYFDLNIQIKFGKRFLLFKLNFLPCPSAASSLHFFVTQSFWRWGMGRKSPNSTRPLVTRKEVKFILHADCFSLALIFTRDVTAVRDSAVFGDVCSAKEQAALASRFEPVKPQTSGIFCLPSF